MNRQDFNNHVRVPRAFLALMLLNVTLIAATIVDGGLHFRPVHWILLGLAVAGTSATFANRSYGLRNQDRIIRLEEMLRLQRLGVDPAPLSLQQLIALRFAADEEVPSLARRARQEQLTSKQIKQTVQQWRADHHRI